MSNKFLNTSSTDLSSLFDGSQSLFLSSIKVGDITPNSNVGTNSDQKLVLRSANDSLQDSYNVDENIITNATNGAIKISQNSGADTDSVLIIKDTDNNETIKLSPNGDINGVDFYGVSFNSFFDVYSRIRFYNGGNCDIQTTNDLTITASQTTVFGDFKFANLTMIYDDYSIMPKKYIDDTIADNTNPVSFYQGLGNNNINLSSPQWINMCNDDHFTHHTTKNNNYSINISTTGKYMLSFRAIYVVGTGSGAIDTDLQWATSSNTDMSSHTLIGSKYELIASALKRDLHCDCFLDVTTPINIGCLVYSEDDVNLVDITYTSCTITRLGDFI